MVKRIHVRGMHTIVAEIDANGSMYLWSGITSNCELFVLSCICSLSSKETRDKCLVEIRHMVTATRMGAKMRAQEGVLPLAFKKPTAMMGAGLEAIVPSQST